MEHSNSAMNEPFALEFENVTKRFDSQRIVVNNLSFFVKAGEFFSILGPSGCGKTTCLRMISGLDTPTSGNVKMAGKIVNKIHPHKRNVHTVFQKYALFPHLNVFENVAFGLRMKKVPNADIKRRVNHMLEMVRLADYGTRSILKLSGGEQQRVALVRALINEPAILLLDEPLAALDLKLREQMQHELSFLQKKLGTTFIFVTHDQGEALTLSDRIAIMNKGNVEQVGTPTEIYEGPASTFVAKFVGTTNLFSGEIERTSNSELATIEVPGFGMLYSRPDENGLKFSVGSKVGLVVRPEKMRVRVSAPPGINANASNDGKSMSIPSLNAVRGTLIERVYFGPTTQIKLQVNENTPPILALIANQASTKMPSLRLGEKYFVVWDPSDCVLVPDSESSNNELKRLDEFKPGTQTTQLDARQI